MNFPLDKPMTSMVRGDHILKNWVNEINREADLVILILAGPKKKGKHYDDLKRYLINECAIPS